MKISTLKSASQSLRVVSAGKASQVGDRDQHTRTNPAGGEVLVRDQIIERSSADG